MFLNELKLKLQGKNCTYRLKLYCGKVISITTNIVWIINHVKVLCTLGMCTRCFVHFVHVLMYTYWEICQMLKMRSFIAIPHTFIVDILCESELQFQQHFLDMDVSAKEIFVFQNPSNEVTEESFHLTFKYKWFICNVMMCRKANTKCKI